MNSSTSTTGTNHFDSGVGRRFDYGFTLSIGVLFFVTMVTFAVYLCDRRSRIQSATVAAPADLEQGLDEASLNCCTKVTTAAVEGSTDACCSICLSDYGDSDVLRQLPDCGHMFHAACVDSWLRCNPTCPVCRTSPMPTTMKGSVEGSTLAAAGRMNR
ncbi:hypothetical protein HPP92_018628 [Vanilla planifolia]|uniref:RING-type domain-containing protein n=1 Tax=Vanilla planifolia TaxID=51239 RepID=A0A835UMK6_VANPL|nr:hypothetical protein HPP92_018628 [Vanilla planifolia]